MLSENKKRIRKIEQAISSITKKFNLTEEMTNGDVNKGLDRLDEARLALNDVMIEEGRGYELPSQTFLMSDPLSVLYKKLFDLHSILRNEVSRRYGPGAPSRLPVGKRR